MDPSTSLNLPSSLQSILLITKTRAGPRLLLHYPPPSDRGSLPNASSHRRRALSSSATDTDADDSDNTSDSSDIAAHSHDIGTVLRGRDRDGNGVRRRSNVDSRSVSGASDLWTSSQREKRRRQNSRRASQMFRTGAGADEDSGGIPFSSDEDLSSGSPSPSRASGRKASTAANNRNSTSIRTSTNLSQGARGALPVNTEEDKARLSWDVVLGHSLQGLAKLLAPTSRAWHKKKFEISLEGRCYVGCPMFEREDGGWGKRKKRRRRSDKQDAGEAEPTKHGDGGEQMLFYTESSNDDNADDEGAGEHDSEHESDDANTTTSRHRSGGEDDDEEVSPTTVRINRQATFSQPQHASSYASSNASDPASLASTNGEVPQPETLTMFNVVFVLTPPQLEHQAQVKTAYTHVVKKFAVALKERQKRTNYVWNEMRKIIQMREKARNDGAHYGKTLPFILQGSTLVAAIAELYNSIVGERIAHLTLDSSVQLSLQIPQPFSAAYLPSHRRHRNYDLWLTSYNAFQLDEDTLPLNNTSQQGGISPHSALLLLYPAPVLLKEIASAKHMAPVLTKALTLYIQHSTPTKSLLQLSKKLRLSLTDLQLLSLHLIHWRRARPLAPLHPSNTYIVSPLADFRKLPKASQAFAARFAALPSLVSLLSKLSSTATKGPVPWISLIPSTDHKAPYMEILEWLVRGGWVTQLRTFAWVKVSQEVKAAVAQQMRNEDRERRASTAAMTVEEEDETAEDDEVEELRLSQHAENESIIKRRPSSFGSASNPNSLLSPRLRPVNREHRAFLHSSPLHTSPRRRTSETGSATSAQTAVRLSSGSRAKPDVSPLRAGRNSSTRTHSRHRLSSSSMSVQSRVPYVVPALAESEQPVEPSDFEPSIVVSPHKANSLESRWLQYIGETLPDAALREVWPKLLKYFDGTHAIEEITLTEGMKRKVINPMLSRLMGDLELLRTVKHW